MSDGRQVHTAVTLLKFGRKHVEKVTLLEEPLRNNNNVARMS